MSFMVSMSFSTQAKVSKCKHISSFLICYDDVGQKKMMKKGYLSKSRKITFYEHQVNVVCDFKSFSQLKEKRNRRGGHKKVHSLLKEKREFWETRGSPVSLSLGLRLPMYIYMNL